MGGRDIETSYEICGYETSQNRITSLLCLNTKLWATH